MSDNGASALHLWAAEQIARQEQADAVAWQKKQQQQQQQPGERKGINTQTEGNGASDMLKLPETLFLLQVILFLLQVILFLSCSYPVPIAGDL